jgi:signal transduction histidine kinase/ActR/RegA family two-component response regulator
VPRLTRPRGDPPRGGLTMSYRATGPSRLPALSFRMLAMAFAVAATIPLVAFTMYVLHELAADEQRARERQLLELARMQSLVVERELASSVRALQILSASLALQQDDLEIFDRELRRVGAGQPSWYAIILLDLNGRQLINTQLPPRKARPRPVEPGSFDEVVAYGRPAVGGITRGPNGVLAFPVRVPVTIGNSLRYVLTAAVRPEALADTVSRQLPRSEEWTRTILDARGAIVARTRAPERFVGTSATAPFLAMLEGAAEGVEPQASIEGELVYAAFSRGATFGWSSAVVVPRAIVDGAVQGSVQALALFSVLVVTATLMGALLFASGIAHGLEQASAAADTLARGEPPPPVRSFVAEVQGVGDALQRSAGVLAEGRRAAEAHLQEARDAQAAAEQAGRAKDEFLAMLGHELRNPLAPIVTALDLLRRRGADTDREHAIITRQVTHLTRLIDDLLDVSRITQGKVALRRERLDLRDAVAQAVEMTAPLFTERGHRLAVDVPADACPVMGDAARLSQIVANLLANAAKYTPPGGDVQLRVARADARLELSVRDTGQGIAPELLPHVFDLFVQGARGAAREQGGLGLGLTIVRQLVQLHGGTIHATSDGPGLGSCFTVRLPPAPVETAAAPVRHAAPAGHPAGSPVAPLRILVVDDNRDAADLLQVLLELGGHDVAVGYDAPSALAVAAAFEPDVALLDLGLPGMDGYGLADALRETLPRPPVIVAVSGYGQAHDQARSAAAGFAAHLVKPVDHDALAATLRQLTEARLGSRAAAPGLFTL